MISLCLFYFSNAPKRPPDKTVNVK